MKFMQDLQDRSKKELDEIYAEGEVPDPDKLLGDFDGTVPAAGERTFFGKTQKPLVYLSEWGILPWNGKSFNEGQRGFNRLLFNKLEIATFEFRVGNSIFDSSRSMILDYALKENFFVLHLIRDEVRLIAEDVLLGQCYFKPTKDFGFYFALQS